MRVALFERIGKYGLVGLVWPCWRKCVPGVGFDVSYAQAMPSVTHGSLMPADQDVEHSATFPASHLHALHVSRHADNRLNL